jgi:hypothetical protein
MRTETDGAAMKMTPQPTITDRCPSCGFANVLFIGEGGHLTCGNGGCKEPSVSRAIEAIKKKQPLTSLNLLRVSQLTYPILMAQMEGEISEAKAGELIGVDIVSLRQMKSQAIKSIMDMLGSLPSPLTLLLEGIKAQQESSTKNTGS